MSEEFRGIENQIVILGWSTRVIRIVKELQQKIGSQGKDVPPIVIISSDTSSGQRASFRRVYFIHGEPTDPEALERARLQYAQAVLIPSLSTAQSGSDGEGVFAMLAVLSVNPHVRICVELGGADTIDALRHIRSKGLVGQQVEFVSFQSVSEHLIAHATVHGGVTKVLDRLLAPVEQRTQLCVAELSSDFQPRSFLEVARKGLESGIIVIGYQRGGEINLNPENRAQPITAGDKIWFLGEDRAQLANALLSAR